MRPADASLDALQLALNAPMKTGLQAVDAAAVACTLLIGGIEKLQQILESLEQAQCVSFGSTDRSEIEEQISFCRLKLSGELAKLSNVRRTLDEAAEFAISIDRSLQSFGGTVLGAAE